MNTPFPFCSDCATWHAPGSHIGPLPQRLDGDLVLAIFLAGMSCGLFLAYALVNS